jgi:hypothetical protein
MLVATKDPGSMNDDEKAIQANLISARQKGFSIPFAPPICKYESGIKQAVGTRCDNEEFGTYDSVLPLSSAMSKIRWLQF